MMETAANIALGVLTNAVYDISMHAGKLVLNRNKAKDFREQVETVLLQEYPEDISYLFESSTFVSYFESPQFLDIINAYIEHKIICDYTRDNAKIQKIVQKSGIINADTIINYVSKNMVDLYRQHGTLNIPSESSLRRAISYILAVIEKVVFNNLSEETSQLAFFLNSRADKYQDQLLVMLTDLKKMIAGIQEKQLSVRDEDYEIIKSKYHLKLKAKNADAHIYLLDKFPFSQFYVPPILENASPRYDQARLFGYVERYRTSWNNIFHKSNIIYVTGGAGYGKSLFIKKIINDFTELNTFRSQDYLVISGELKSFYPNESDSALSVIEFLKESIKNNTLMDVSNDFIEYYLNSGRCIILLDALDEVEKTKRIHLHESIVAFFKNENPNNKICITSRERGFIPERNIEVFKICPLNQEQIEKYVDKIIALKKFEKEDKDSFMKQSDILVQKGFLNSFLVLSLLINIYKAELKLPENRLELYQKCFEYIANRREKEKTQEGFDWRIISPIMKDNTFIELSKMGMPNNSNIDKGEIQQRLLAVYKSKYASEVDAENAIDEFLKFCSDRTELFVPSSEDKFKFFHRSFFEYFYALYIFLRCADKNTRLRELLKFDVDSEVFELTISMLKQKNEVEYQALVELMFDRADAEMSINQGDFSVFNILILCMQVIDDVLYKKRFLRLITSHKSIILDNIEKFHNLELVSSIFENDEGAYQEICNAYSEKFKYFLLDNCNTLFSMAQEYSEEIGEDFFEQIFGNRFSIKVRRRLHGRYIDMEKYFYVPIFRKICDCKAILLSMDQELILALYKKISPRKYKQKAVRASAIIEKMKGMTDLQQDQIMRYVVAGSYIF